MHPRRIYQQENGACQTFVVHVGCPDYYCALSTSAHQDFFRIEREDRFTGRAASLLAGGVLQLQNGGL